MADPLVSTILNQLAAILQQKIDQELNLVSGARKEFHKLESEFKSIKAVLVDAEKRQVKEEVIKVWVENLKDIAYDAEDVLDEWITAMQKAKIEEAAAENQSSAAQKVSSFLNLPYLGYMKVNFRRGIALKIKKINERLVDIAREKDRYKLNAVMENESSLDRPKSASFIVESQVKGRDLDRDTMIKMLLSDENQDPRRLNVVAILGMGGIGKTTLAQAVYNSPDVLDHFEKIMWVCVSEPFDVIRVAKSLLEVLDGKSPHLNELETVTGEIRSRLRGKKFLLVLDDIWTDDFTKWEQLFNSLMVGTVGSAVLITTRNERVAKAMGSMKELCLAQLSDYDSWSLFKSIAFHDKDAKVSQDLENVGRQIVIKCKGLPLTLKTMGSLMRFKQTSEEWLDVLNSDFWELQETEGLFPPLMFSYYDLPSAMKPCFLFCAFFPKDYVIDADNLVQLWMAQGYLSTTENIEMEVIGREYLENLAMRSLFQDLDKDKDGKRIISFKLHDMVHDLALYLTKNDFSHTEMKKGFNVDPSRRKARHLTLVRAEGTPFPNVTGTENLFSFWVQSFYDSPPIINHLDRIEPGFFLGLIRLKALDLSRNMMGELPKEIGKLTRLKYLNLSHNPFTELPQTLSDLISLQTLKLNYCNHLRKLPGGIGKLVNMRHLEINHTDSLKTLPKGICHLASIQTLSRYIVAEGNGGGDVICDLEEINSLNNLRGFLKLEGLGYISTPKEARKAQLQQKNHLSEVHLDFIPSIQKGGQGEEVIEALQLHENVQSLHVSSYGGPELPSWIMNLKNLQKLHLRDCRNCANLPPLGRLPSLVMLRLESMTAVKSLGTEFLGIDAKPDSASSSKGQTLFPKLKKLKISRLDNWEEWDMMIRDETVHDLIFEIMPRLRYLKVSHCSKLKELPSVLLQRSPLAKLHILHCQLLQERYNKVTGKDRTKISHISKSRISY